jgi:hypothetical protein
MIRGGETKGREEEGVQLQDICGRGCRLKAEANAELARQGKCRKGKGCEVNLMAECRRSNAA